MIEELFEAKRAIRLECIKNLVEESGLEFTSLSDPEMFPFVLEYDFGHAPFTTNRKQLAEIFIEAPTTLEGMSDEDLEENYNVVIDGLARLHIYVVTNSDKTLREKFDTLLLAIEDSVRDLPPVEGVCEYIELQ